MIILKLQNTIDCWARGRISGKSTRQATLQPCGGGFQEWKVVALGMPSSANVKGLHAIVHAL